MFRCDAGLKIGMGHHARCRALASWLADDDVSFVVGVDEGGRHALEDDKNTLCIPAGASEADERDLWRANDVVADAVVFDLSYAARVARREATLSLMDDVGGASARRIAIDSLGSQALLRDGDKTALDAIVIPYVGAQAPRTDRRAAIGPRYFTLPHEWPPQPRRETRDVKRVLITMGGSDPYGLSLRALDGVMAVAKPDWTIRVVVGSAFSPWSAEALRGRAATDPRIELTEAPKNMAPHLIWADLAVASTGLTKYELAWAGLPSVQISIDVPHALVNEAFAAGATAIHLGTADKVGAPDIAGAVASLASDEPRRAEMIHRGQALVDGRGGARVVQIIRELIDACH